jgi:hypothetical protein
MKTRSLLTAALTTLIFVACSNENEAPYQPVTDGTASLKITLVGTRSGTRAADTALPTEGSTGTEQAINRAVVALFKADGSLIEMKEFTALDLVGGNIASFEELEATSDPTTVAAYINYPESSFDKLTTKTEFDQLVMVLTTEYTRSNLPMYGTSTIDELVANVITAKTIDVVRRVARISLEEVDVQIPSESTEVFTPQAVYIYDVVGKDYAGADYTQTDADYIGSIDDAGQENPSYPFLKDTYTAGNKYWYYVFPNDGKDPAHDTKLVLKGTWEDGIGGAPSTVYYTVCINRKDPNTTLNSTDSNPTIDGGVIQRNWQYVVKMTIKGKGAPIPETTAGAEITMNVVPWHGTVTQDALFDSSKLRFAGSNIYWDAANNRLTFADTGATTPENVDRYQGVFFAYGSIIGVSPYNDGNGTKTSNFSIATSPLFVPDPSTRVYTATNSWPTIGGITLTILGDIPNLGDPGSSDYTYEITPDYANYTGDICAFLSGRTGVPAGKWRLPTAKEWMSIGTSNISYSSEGEWSVTTDGNNHYAEANQTDGTGVISNYVTRNASGTKLPLSGYRYTSYGTLQSVGSDGHYWASNGKQFNPATTKYSLNGDKRFYDFASFLPVRCVKEVTTP